MRFHSLAYACLFYLAAAPSAARADPPAPRYDYRAVHDPNGIGKFYMGREIAHVMGHLAADWLDRPEREAEEAPKKLLAALKLKPGDTVADIGAGTGYLTFPIARQVGPTGRVLAVDIQPEMLDLLKARIKKEQLTNIAPVLGTATKPNLPARSVDLALMVDVYHEFSHPYEMIEQICRSMKDGGRIAFVEYRAEDPDVPIKRVHKMTEKQVRLEMTPHPLRWTETLSILPRQHIIVFEKLPAGTSRDKPTKASFFTHPSPPLVRSGRRLIHFLTAAEPLATRLPPHRSLRTDDRESPGPPVSPG